MAGPKKTSGLSLGLARVLRSLADELEQLPEETLQALASGQMDISVRFGERVRVAEAKSRREPRDSDGPDTGEERSAEGDVEFLELETKLRRCESREAGLSLLVEAFGTKRSLERFARYLDVGVQKRDTIETLRDKVVSTTIGYRLRSDAIRGER